METIGDFVTRTGGPVVPFVEAWYPWVYAHHYLRGELTQLPTELGVVGSSLSLDDARQLIEVWCGLTGESIDDGARRLADEYLRRWGMSAAAPDGIGVAAPTRERPRRAARSAAGQRGRAARAAAEAPAGTEVAAAGT